MLFKFDFEIVFEKRKTKHDCEHVPKKIASLEAK